MLGDLIQKVVGAVQATDLAVRCHNSRLHRWLRSPNTEVPPADVLPHSYRRTTTPYLYSPQQLTDLLQAERGRPAAPAAARHHLGGGDRAARLGSTTTTWTSRGRADGARGGVRQDSHCAGALHHPRRPADLHGRRDQLCQHPASAAAPEHLPRARQPQVLYWYLATPATRGNRNLSWAGAGSITLVDPHRLPSPGTLSGKNLARARRPGLPGGPRASRQARFR